MTSYGTRTHGKLHKRGNSGSSLASPPLPPAPEYATSDYKSSGEFRPTFRHDVWEDPLNRSVGANSLKVKPYLRKLSSKDDARIDLSKTTEENERIAGLGMIGSDPNISHRSVQDVTFVPVKSRHGRTTSNGSQYSTSSMQRPSMPYGHPIRATPRPYTPPIAKSYANSLLSDEMADDPAELIMSEDYRSRLFSEHHRTNSNGSLNRPPPLHLHTSSSFTRLNASQSSIPSSLPTGGRARGDTLRSMETLNSPSSGRASLDKAVSFLSHKNRNQSTDELNNAASRAASIRAARAAYNEKEEAKDAKYEKEALKKAEQRARKEERQRRKSDATTARTRSESGGDKEKAEFVGKAYSEYGATHARALPTAGPTRPRGDMHNSRGSSGKGAKSTWQRFMIWLRTRFLRMGKGH